MRPSTSRIGPITAIRAPRCPAMPSPRRTNLVATAILLLTVYSAIGAGIGLVLDSTIAGALVGLLSGACAVAAILLISGAALTDTAIPEQREALSLVTPEDEVAERPLAGSATR
jgi:hypothetical protein